MSKQFVVLVGMVIFSLLFMVTIEQVMIRYNILDKQEKMQECILNADKQKFENMKASGLCEGDFNDVYTCTTNVEQENGYNDKYKQSVYECSLIFN